MEWKIFETSCASSFNYLIRLIEQHPDRIIFVENLYTKLES